MQKQLKLYTESEIFDTSILESKVISIVRKLCDIWNVRYYQDKDNKKRLSNTEWNTVSKTIRFEGNKETPCDAAAIDKKG